MISFQGMDISDIDLVIVYGVPDSMNQLYQVPKFNIKECNKDCAYVFLLLSYVVALVEGAAKQGHTSFIIRSRRMSMLK